MFEAKGGKRYEANRILAKGGPVLHSVQARRQEPQRETGNEHTVRSETAGDPGLGAPRAGTSERNLGEGERTGQQGRV